MIVSASYRTDIPTFYGEWFLNRLRAGYCMAVNPYNHRLYRVELNKRCVDGFVFWTKNLEPFLPRLAEVHERGFPFVVQYTINGYPRELESKVVDTERSVGHVELIAREYGPRVAVWRYDTILVTSITSLDFHSRNFAGLARRLEGATDEVVVSFAQVYQKTRRNLDIAAREQGFAWLDPEESAKRKLLAELSGVSRSHGMRLSVCGQRHLLGPGVGDASCIDASRLSDVAGRTIEGKRPGHRPDCDCHASRDIGDYDTCPHGCVYCYGVGSRETALRHYSQHDPEGEFLRNR